MRIRHPKICASQLTKNIGHFIFEVLRGNQGVQEFLSTLNHGVDLTTTSSKIGVVVESLPEVVDRLVAGLGTGIDENTNLRLNDI